ncbi:ABC transporter permease [Arthrobacter sp. 31Y]|uniref:ABC transporter permease n=1 Tax=Arthrobacter sp. 31Y TaxID=1115632 RepID=UPI0004653D3F|nr:ABC transporter permease [Arthrobacter sp. 31Y]
MNRLDRPVTLAAPSRRSQRIKFTSVNIPLTLGLLLMGALVLVALIGQVWTPFDPQATGVGVPFSPPDSQHWFGTDAVGADIFSKTLAATATDFGVTLVSVGLAFLAGGLIGAVTGFVGGIFDTIVMRLVEILQAFPPLLLAMLIVVTTGPGITNVVIVIMIVGIPGYLRLARAEVLSQKTMEYADAARMVGHSGAGVLLRHLVPNTLSPLISFAAVNAAWVAIIISSLGFIGVGIEPGSPEWGSMIAAGRNDIDSWWISLFPGVAIIILACAFYLVGDGLTDREHKS